MTPVQIKAMLRANIFTRPAAAPRSNTAESILAGLEALIDSLTLGSWVPLLAVQADGNRAVFKVVDWTGGIGEKPTAGQYVGATGYVATAALAQNVRGVTGWSPVFAIAANGPYLVQQLADWIGGEGVKPAVGQYVGATGLVTDINQAVNIRGTQGLPGAAGSETKYISTSPADGLAVTRYYPIATLVSNADYVRVQMFVKGLDAASMQPIAIDAYFVIRGGFQYEYEGQGPIHGYQGGNAIAGGGASLQVYGDQYNITVVMKVTNYYRLCGVRVEYSSGATVFSQLVGTNTAPAGAIIFDSELPASYRPLQWKNAFFSQFNVGNMDGAYAPPSNIGGVAGLTMTANQVAGQSDLAFLNSNLASAGFSFWQQLTANTKKILFFLKGSLSRVGINTDNPAATLDILATSGNSGLHVTSSGGTYDSWIFYQPDGKTYLRGPVMLADTDSAAVCVGVAPASPQKFNVDGNILTRGVMAYGGLPAIAKGAACNAATLGTNSADMAGTITATTTSGHTAGTAICTVTFNTALARPPKIQLTCMSEAAATNISKIYVTTTVNGFTIMNTANGLDFGNTYQYAYSVII